VRLLNYKTRLARIVMYSESNMKKFVDATKNEGTVYSKARRRGQPGPEIKK
jgi:hypothetical protein